MKYLLFLLLIVLSDFPLNSQYSLQEILSIKEKNYTLGDFYIYNNTIVSLWHEDGSRNGKIFIVDNKGKEIFIKKNLKQLKYITGNFNIYNNKLYFYSDGLKILNLKTYKIQSYKIKITKYKVMRIFNDEKIPILIFDNDKTIMIFKLPTLEYLGKIVRKHEVKDIAYTTEYSDSLILYGEKENELVAYDIIKKEEKWKFSAGKAGAYYLGIKLGSFNNRLANYKIIKDNGKKYIYLATFVGNLYKLDFKTGKIIKKREYIGGKVNNGGLIPQFSLVDMNKDSVKDLVGGSVDHNMYCIDGKNLKTIWKFDSGNEIQDPNALYDITGDGIPEVFFGNRYDSKLFILNGKNGKVILEKSLNAEKDFSSPIALDDFNGNGILDVVIGADPHTIKVFELEGTKIKKNKLIWQTYQYK